MPALTLARTAASAGAAQHPTLKNFREIPGHHRDFSRTCVRATGQSQNGPHVSNWAWQHVQSSGPWSASDWSPAAGWTSGRWSSAF